MDADVGGARRTKIGIEQQAITPMAFFSHGGNYLFAVMENINLHRPRDGEGSSFRNGI